MLRNTPGILGHWSLSFETDPQENEQGSTESRRRDSARLEAGGGKASDLAGGLEPGHLRVFVHRFEVHHPRLEHAHAIKGFHDRLVDLEARERARGEEVLAA